MTLKEKLQHRYALSEKGAQDMIRAFISVTISDIVLMLPVGMLYMLVKYYMADDLNGRGGFFAIGCIACLILIAVTTYIQYNATFLNTYIESGVRRTTLAEKLRKIPLSFFGKERSVRPYQCDYGRLCHHGDSIFALDSGTDRCVYFYSISGCEPFLFELENGNRSSLGTSGFISDRALFR